MVFFLTLLQNYVYNERGFKSNSAQNRLSQHAQNRFMYLEKITRENQNDDFILDCCCFKTKNPLSLEGLHYIFSWPGQLYESLFSLASVVFNLGFKGCKFYSTCMHCIKVDHIGSNPVQIRSNLPKRNQTFRNWI